MFPKSNVQGFVLPYVLVVIAVLAVAGTIAATRLQTTTQTLSAIQAKAKAERMMDAAEATAVFALLSGNAVPGGYDLNPQSVLQTEFGPMSLDGRMMDPRVAQSITQDIWSVAGGLRRVQTPDGPVIIHLQDVMGLPSLAKAMSPYLRTILVYAGATPREVDGLVKALADYTDVDNDRRANGAERSEYNLRRMPPPTNSPLRSYAELSSVLGWTEAIARLDMRRVKEMSTLQPVDYREQFAQPAHAQILGIASDSLLTPNFELLLDGAGLRGSMPSGSMRLTLWAPRGDGQWDKRVIEIVRQTGHITKPYRRLWVLDTTVLETELLFNTNQISDIAHVINPASLRP